MASLSCILVHAVLTTSQRLELTFLLIGHLLTHMCAFLVVLCTNESPLQKKKKERKDAALWIYVWILRSPLKNSSTTGIWPLVVVVVVGRHAGRWLVGRGRGDMRALVIFKIRFLSSALPHRLLCHTVTRNDLHVNELDQTKADASKSVTCFNNCG